ncbi:UTP--glucose-1-phosphate uridylyltransferase [Cryptosporangium phraense]|uniref:UTP--glucose-1-phosphate uridylyltransferase n=1 Tax=Cryptosporangium phraense TaxID=2593070 RepID=A0A545AW29_9ACTN|nr:UTP--glucose-1-phosphate uridylyltransferase [Cryptosporangium phraense]TQS45549.1 UTP--glucose-1-phosphate uridylyltransferase [Cryptosporangium phraense]
MVDTSAANKSRSTRKAVIPAAGLGTRFLPATKAVPKELLPVVDKPALEYIVEESAAAGLDDVLLVTGRGKSAMVDHFDRRPDLEQQLEAKGDTKRLEAIRRSSEIAAINTSRQGEPKGLGHAVLCGASHVGNEPFAVMLGDDLIDARDPILPTMLDVQAEHGGIVLALLEVPREHIKRYGIVAVETTGRTGEGHLGDIVRVTSMVEKPEPDDAPSNLAIIGRYVLPPEIFDAIRETKPGAGGEIQLTDAMAALLAEGTPVHGVVFKGRRYDTGAKIDYLKAVVQLGVDHEELGSEFRDWLTEYVRTSLA